MSGNRFDGTVEPDWRNPHWKELAIVIHVRPIYAVKLKTMPQLQNSLPLYNTDMAKKG